MKHLTTIKDMALAHLGIICDLWGVIHNGHEAYDEALSALKIVQDEGLFLVLLSNSPRPSEIVGQQISALGVTNDYYNALITSGDLAREFLVKAGKKVSFFHLGPERDRRTTEGLPNPEVDDLKAADYILCTGFFEDWGFELAAYEAFLSAAVAGEIPMICANPDKEVDIGNKRLLCSGTLAEYYERLGGKVHRLGKPEKVAYQKCYEVIREKLGCDCLPEDLLAIGDNLETDIIGAARQGMKTVLITDGLHSRHNQNGDLEALMKKLNVYPDAVMKRLKW